MYYSMSFCQFYNYNNEQLGPLDIGDLGVTRNTWEHWHLVPTKRPAIIPPSPKTSFVSIEGRNGSIDLSQALTGYPTYESRKGSIEFLVMNDYRNWQTAYTDIMTTVHGKKLMMVYEEDPEYYYVGRWAVSGWTTGDKYSTITFSYVLDPYKYRLSDCAGSWLWDPFNFKTGVIANRADSYNTTKNIDTSGDDFVYLLNTQYYRGDIKTDSIGVGYYDEQENISNVIGNAPVILTLGVYPDEDNNKTITVRFENFEVYPDPIVKTYTAQKYGEDPDFVVTNYTGINNVVLSAKGTGTVSWNFRPGRL